MPVGADTAAGSGLRGPGAIAGVVIPTVFAVLLALALLEVFLRLRRTKKQLKEAESKPRVPASIEGMPRSSLSREDSHKTYDNDFASARPQIGPWT
jgi:hypothetical protein